MTDETGTVESRYGALGEVRRTLRDVDPGQPGRSPIRFDTRFVYGSMGRLLRIGYPDGETVTNRYDAGGPPPGPAATCRAAARWRSPTTASTGW